MVVVGVEFTSIQFSSDHGTLRHSFDWTDDGELFGEPECTARIAPKSYPISQTKYTNVALAFTLKVTPAQAAFKIQGTGSPANLNFASSSMEATGSDQSVVMTTNERLPNVVGVLSENISWKVLLVGPEPDVAIPVVDTEHTIYLTYGTPEPASDNTKTRLETFCGWANGAITEEDVSNLIGPDATAGPPFFNTGYSIIPNQLFPSRLIKPIWEIMDTGGDCISQATFMDAGLGLLGTSGGEVGYVMARHNSWSSLWSTSQEYEIDADLGRLIYINNSNPNMYEGCCRVSGKYWMGGTGQSRTKAVEVLYSVAGPRDLSSANHQCYEFDLPTKVSFPEGDEPTY